jgi:hypothetical protein
MHRRHEVPRRQLQVRVLALVVASATIACGIDALGQRVDLAPPTDRASADGNAASVDVDATAPAVDADTTIAVAADAGADADAEADAPLIVCSEDGGVRNDGHCYFPIAPTTQPLAKQACVAAGGHLVTVSSLGEHTFLATVGTGDRWIGLEAAAPTNDRAQYNWVTGETKTVAYWYVNDPDNMGPCVALHGTLQEWVDRGCGDTNAAICERE